MIADAVAQPAGLAPSAAHFGVDAWQRKDGAGGLPTTEVTLPQLLGTVGYRSLLVGKWHLGQLQEHWPRRRGFDRYLGTISTHDHGHMTLANGSTARFPCTVLVRDDAITHRLTNGRLASAANPRPPGWPAGYPAAGGGPDPTRAADECSGTAVASGGDGAQPFGVDGLMPLYTNETTAFVRAAVAASEPFLLVYTPDNTHVPVYASARFVGTSTRGLYGDAVQELDWSIGELLDAIDGVGAKENTLVVVTSDNGAQGGAGNNGCQGMLRCMKGTTWEGGFREPGIVRYPALVPGGGAAAQRRSQLVSTMDIFATALELARVSPPPGRPLDGKSLVPVLRDGAPSQHPDYFYWRGNAVFAMRHGDFKLHFYTQGCTDYWTPGLVAHDPPLIFHLLRDPGEAYPLNASLPENVALVAEATAALRAHEAAVAADGTKGAPQLNLCNEATALWPPAQRASVKPLDKNYTCTYQG